MEDERKVTLKELHRYYAEEARHQRSMMWETAKWFVPIISVVFGATFTGIIRQYSDNPVPVPVWILLIPILIGFILSLTCIALTYSFYKTNLINLSTLIKIEDKMDFDDSTTFSVFRTDKFITWQPYLSRRRETVCSQNFVQDNLKYDVRRMHTLISIVFAIFAIAFVVLTFPVLDKAGMLNKFSITVIVVVSFILFLATYLVLQRIRKN